MAVPPLGDLDSLLASLNQLKPPGASKGKISTITSICVHNIHAESTVVQSLYRAFKKAPGTHKLGTLYVIDSVVRQWIESAKKQGQELNIDGRGEPGTYPAAVRRVTELMPALFDDIIKSIPEEQKPKLENVLTIWERGHTFPQKLLADFKVRVAAKQPAANDVRPKHAEKFTAPIRSRPAATPVGLPPDYLFDQGFITTQPSDSNTAKANGVKSQDSLPPQMSSQPTVPAQGSTQSVNAILASLANMVPVAQAPPAPAPASTQQPSSAPPSAAIPNIPLQLQGQGVPAGLPPQIAALLGQGGQANASAQFQPPTQLPMPPFPGPASAGPAAQQGFQPPPAYPGYGLAPPPSIPQQPAFAPPPQQQPTTADVLAPLRGILPPSILNDPTKLMQALSLLQDLQRNGVPMDQWGPVIQAFNSQVQNQPPPEPERHQGHDTHERGRGRSRSPERGGGRRRASPVYGTYDEIQARKQAEDDRGGRGAAGRRYRQRSPVPSPGPRPYDNTPAPLAMNGAPMQAKYIGIDSSLPPNNIKVLSRTLFVGGASGTQADIEQLFGQFAKVQTCIANREKRHAFVKLTTRQGALDAKAGMEYLQSINDRDTMATARQTKWGVGFGPRECCDYGKGESIIPISKLTEADMKWLLTAEYGGTGGRSVESGMVLEEPDIEIGAGVSSKAMSKRVVNPDGASATASPSNKKPDRQVSKRRFGGGARDDAVAYGNNSGNVGLGAAAPPTQMESYGYARPEPVAVATPPAVPGFGFSFTQR